MNKKPKPRDFEKVDAWTKNEIILLKKFYPGKNISFVAQKINRSEDAIRAKAIKLKLKKENYFWQLKDENFLLKNWEVLHATEIAEKLNKTKWAVINKYRELSGKRKDHKKLPL